LQQPHTLFIRLTQCIRRERHSSNKEERKVKLAKTIAVVGVAVFGSAFSSQAAEYQIQTLNMTAHGMFQFEPQQLKIQPGDTVHFVAKDKGHNVESIDGMIPDGAAPFKGGIGKDLTVTFTKPGVYGFKCAPHYSMGMVGLIVVGDPASNLQKAEAVNQPGKAKPAFAALFKAIGTQTAAQH
jgi:pseudoazurin